jgi:hypothetical protein
MPGFGTEPPGRGPRGFRADLPPANQTDDLHAIKERYCGPKTLSPQIFSFVANAGARFDLTGTMVNQIVLTTKTGSVSGWFSDNSNAFGKAATIPHFVGDASIAANTETIPLPPATDYIITLQEGAGATATGTITFMYV